MSALPSPSAAAPLARSTVLLFALACGLVAANLYYAQPLTAAIAADVGLAAPAASLIVTLTQVGYCLGLLLLVPLGDLLENRRLIAGTLLATTAAVALAAGAGQAPLLLAAAFAIGLSSVVVQMLVPMAAHLAPEATRGRVVGTVMSGLLGGIMLARPVSSLIAGSLGWRAVFAGSAVAMLALAALLWRLLPRRQPPPGPAYGALLASMWRLWRETPLLRRRAVYQASLFAVFSLYWTAVPLLLTGPGFGLSQHGVAGFTLAGVAGAFAAPLSGHLADRGHSRLATGLAIGLVLLSFVLAALGVLGGPWALAALVVAGIVLDLGVQANLVVGQREIYALGAEVRSRLNALYMATFFAGGATGSALASISFAYGGWLLVCGLGAAVSAAALAYFATEPR